MNHEKIMLSFLGAGKLQETTYSYQDKQHTTILFAEALQTFFPDHTMYVIMTDKARDTNGSKLDEACTFDEIPIPTGGNETEVWEMFNAITAAIPPKAELILDVTHGFRSQPMLGLAACVYLQAVKDVHITHILYGAFEAKNEETNITPVFDLTPFLDLIEWSNASRQFLKFGNAASLKALLSRIHGDTYRFQHANPATALKNLGNAIDNVTTALNLVRPEHSLQAAETLPQKLEQSQADVANIPQVRPLADLLTEIEQRFTSLTEAQGDLFSEAGFQAQATMIDLCYQDERYQQAITLSREAIVSKLCVHWQLDHIEGRSLIESQLGVWSKLIAQGKGNILKPYEREYGSLWDIINDVRNDINHAGMRKQTLNATKLKNQIDKACMETKAFITRSISSEGSTE